MNKIKSFFRSRFLEQSLPFLLLVVFITVFAILTNGEILNKRNMTNIYQQALTTAIAATAVAFIYSTGNIDISIGSIICCACVIGGKIYVGTGNLTASLLLVGISAFAMLMLNGVISSILGIKPMVCAIVIQTVYKAIAQQLLGATTININYSDLGPVQSGPLRLILFISYFLFALLIFHFTKLGKQMRFLGGNEKCAKTVGIRPKKTVLLGYVVASIGIGIAAVTNLIRTGTASIDVPTTGTDVMLATVLGGMSIFGGHKSNSYAGVIGAVVIVSMSKALMMIGVNNEIIQGVRGVLFLLIVYLTSEKSKTIPCRMDF